MPERHADPTAIRITGLVKAFGSTRAVDGIDLDIEPGELFFLLGPSGCGKTTLLRMIAGFIDPTDGRIAFANSAGQRDVTHVAPNKRNTGMVFQSYALWPHMTVEANVAYGLKVRKVAQGERAGLVRDALAAVQMEQYAERKPNQLSGGQQQRVALVIRPDVLLLDEPLSNLDAKLRNDLRGEIRRICKASGITTVYVTHDQKEALSMADRIALLREGKVVQLGTPADLYRRPASRFAAEFIGETNLINATAGEPTGDRLPLQTQSGQLVATLPPGMTAPPPGTGVTCSIRPEALRLSTTPNGTGAAPGLVGTRTESTYFGDTAHHTVDVPGVGRVRIAEHNPVAQPSEAGGEVACVAEPGDVVLLPD